MTVNDCLFYFSVYFEGSPPAEEPSGLLPRGEDPQMFPTFPYKRQLFTCGQVPVLSMDSLLRFGKHPRALTPSDGTTSGEPTRTRT